MPLKVLTQRSQSSCSAAGTQPGDCTASNVLDFIFADQSSNSAPANASSLLLGK